MIFFFSKVTTFSSLNTSEELLEQKSVYADETLTTVVSALIIHKKIEVKPENC